MDFLEQTDGEKLQCAIFESVKRCCKFKPSGVIYDVINSCFYGKKSPRPSRNPVTIRKGCASER
jgi:hypothetical protein